MGLTLRTVWFDLYRRRLNFLLVVIVAAIAIYMLDMVLMIREQANYQIHMLKNYLIHEEQLINIAVIYDHTSEDDLYNDRVIAFASMLQEKYPEQYGYSSETPISIQEKDGEKQDVLYLDQITSGICELRDIEGKEITLTEGMCDSSVWPVYIGYDLQDTWSVGDVITDRYQNRKFVVAGVLEKGSGYIGFPILGSIPGIVSLDQYMVCAHPAVKESDTMDLIFLNSYNRHFVRTEKDQLQDTQKEIRQLADACGVKMYSKSVEEIIAEYRQENKELFDAIGVLCIFTLLIAVCAIGSASLADVYSRQYDFGIMYIQGVSNLQIYMIIMLEILIKLVLAGSLAIAFYARGLNGEKRYVHNHMAIPMVVIMIVILAFVVSYVSYRGIIKHKMTDYIGVAFR